MSRDLGRRRPTKLTVMNQTDVVSPSGNINFALEAKRLPSSPLDEIGFQAQINNGHKQSNNVTDEDLDSDKALNSLIGLERRFSMVSIESSLTTGRLLDHLELNDDGEDIDWESYNDKGSPIRTVTNTKSKEMLKLDISKTRTTPVKPPFNDQRSINMRSAMENRNRTLTSQLLEKRLPSTPVQVKRQQNYAPADKFPSLQRRFMKSKLTDTASPLPKPHELERPTIHTTQSEPHFVAVGASDTVDGRTRLTSTSKINSTTLVEQSILTTPRRFAKDFSDQFDDASPKRKDPTDSKLLFSSPMKPKHSHSRSNPVNFTTSHFTTKKHGRSLTTTPSPRSSLKRSPSTPASQGKMREALIMDKLIFAKLDEVAPETRVSLAIELRRKNQPQEATYQLQLAAEGGNKDAMLLYGLSLRYGYGVRRDDRQSFLWLCRGADIDLIRTYKFEIDPFELQDHQFPAKPQEPLSSTLLEIGKSYMNGWGVDRDESYGVQFIEKLASMGFAEAMVEAGKTWSTKGPHRKKNMHRSAAWFRLAEKLGMKVPGNSWIYKSKYKERE